MAVGRMRLVLLTMGLLLLAGCQSTSPSKKSTTKHVPVAVKQATSPTPKPASKPVKPDITFTQAALDKEPVKKLAESFDTISLKKFKLQQHNLYKTELTNAILFETDSAESYSIESKDVSAIAEIFNSGELGKNLYIVGHTDSRGNESYNLRLSLRRAMSVATKLVEEGVDVSRIKLVPAGEYQPIAPNKRGSFINNRRVDILSANSKALLSAFIREQDCRGIDKACQQVELSVISLEKDDALGVVMKSQRYDSVTVAAPGKSNLRQLSTDLKEKGAVAVDEREQQRSETVRTGIAKSMIRDTFSMDVIMREPLVFKTIVRDVLRFDAKHIIK
ncbi:MAG: OmpA family protein [Alteromonadaceae bacterium]|nr:OmpA family protein [Alteromonadaceae bacterium]